MNNELDDVWAYCDELPTAQDAASVRRGECDSRSTYPGRCVVGKRGCKLLTEGLTTDQPGHAECCKDCDGYQGPLEELEQERMQEGETQ